MYVCVHTTSCVLYLEPSRVGVDQRGEALGGHGRLLTLLMMCAKNCT